MKQKKYKESEIDRGKGEIERDRKGQRETD